VVHPLVWNLPTVAGSVVGLDRAVVILGTSQRDMRFLTQGQSVRHPGSESCNLGPRFLPDQRSDLLALDASCLGLDRGPR
jgi:hypothetical protein